jgi:hypothetical protein
VLSSPNEAAPRPYTSRGVTAPQSP